MYGTFPALISGNMTPQEEDRGGLSGNLEDHMRVLVLSKLLIILKS